MPAYVDVPTIQRSHGLSGHLIGDPLVDAHAVAKAIGLSDRYFIGEAIVPHYQMPSGRRSAAIAAGAIPLDPDAWRQLLPRCRRDATGVHPRRLPAAQATRQNASTRRRPTTPETLDLFAPSLP